MTAIFMTWPSLRCLQILKFFGELEPVVVFFVESPFEFGILSYESYVARILRLVEHHVEFLNPRFHLCYSLLTVVDSLLSFSDLLLMRLVSLVVLSSIAALSSSIGVGRCCDRTFLDRLLLCRSADGLIDSLGVVGSQIVVDAADMLGDVPASKLIDFRYKSVEEIAVMADDDSCTIEGFDSLL